MERWAKVYVALLVAIAIFSGIFYELPVSDGCPPSKLVDCWKLNVAVWEGKHRIWPLNESYLLKNYDLLRAIELMKYVGTLYTDGEHFYTKGKFFYVERPTWDLNFTRNPARMIRKIGENLYEVDVFVTKPGRIVDLPKKSDELVFRLRVGGFEIKKLNEKANKTLMETDVPLGGSRTAMDYYYNMSRNVTAVVTGYIRKQTYLLKGICLPFFVSGGAVDDLKPLAEQVKKYVREYHYDRAQELAIAADLVYTMFPYNDRINTIPNLYGLLRWVKVYRGMYSYRTMIVAYSYVGNVAVNGGICEDRAFVGAILMKLLGFDSYVMILSGKGVIPHAEMAVNASNVSLGELFDYHFYAIFKIKVGKRNLVLVDLHVFPNIAEPYEKIELWKLTFKKLS